MDDWLTLAAFRISAFGDAAVLMAVAAIVAAFADRWGTVRRSPALLLSVLACIATVAALKLLASGIADTVATPQVRFSLSGHAALATLVYGAAAVLAVRAGRGRSRPVRAVALCGATLCGALVLLIGISRIRLGAHGIAEVVAGFGVGMLFLLPATRPSPPRIGAVAGLTVWAVFAAAALAWLGLIATGNNPEAMLRSGGSALAQWLAGPAPAGASP